jgi:uncharacterized protein (DUF1778 family)
VVTELAAPATEVAELLGRAVALGVQARSQFTVEAVFRIASKLGYTASVTTLNQFDPPTFTKGNASAPSPAPAVPSSESKPKRSPAKKGGKKRATS